MPQTSDDSLFANGVTKYYNVRLSPRTANDVYSLNNIVLMAVRSYAGETKQPLYRNHTCRPIDKLIRSPITLNTMDNFTQY